VRVFRIALLAALAMVTANVGAASPTSAQATPDWAVLDSLRGKVVLLDFWASWCSPCLKSFPWMNEVQKKLGADGFVIVAVNVDQDRALADAFMKKVPAQFRVEYDPKGALARQFDVQAMPTSFLIDRNGQIRVRHAGFKEKQRDEREDEIVKLLKEKS
jgi:thiol-disulfide isomerase/thioredoxin